MSALKASLKKVRAYWDQRPCNVRHSPSPIGTVRYFSEVEARRYYVEPHIAIFAQFSRWKGKQILEVGCGIGTDTINFARAGASVTALELSPESLALARQQAKVFGLEKRIRFIQANVEELCRSLARQNFDLIYSFGVIHHTPNPARAIASLRKFMGPKSELRIMLYAKHSWKAYMIEAGLDQPEAQFGCPIAFTYTPEEVHKLLRGFKVTNIEQTHIFPYKIPEYREYRYELQPWFAAMPAEMYGILRKKLGWHLLVTAVKA